jgi:hypothetical protein
VIVRVHNDVGAKVVCSSLAPVPSWAWPAPAQKQYTTGAVKSASIGGRPFFMPVSADTTGILYNKSMVGPGLFKPARGDC